jgi:hypothetical protein
MAIDINSLFADIIDTPEQRQQKLLQQGMLQGDNYYPQVLRGLSTQQQRHLAQIGGQLRGTASMKTLYGELFSL